MRCLACGICPRRNGDNAFVWLVKGEGARRFWWIARKDAPDNCVEFSSREEAVAAARRCARPWYDRPEPESITALMIPD